jgi:hypothetical protein
MRIVRQEENRVMEMESLGSDTLVLITNIGVFAVPLVMVVGLAPRLLPLTLVYFRDVVPWQKNLMSCCLLLIMFQAIASYGVFDQFLSGQPNSIIVVVLFTLAPTFCIASACKHARICHPCEAIALLGLPVGVVISILCVIGVIKNLAGLSIVSVMGLLPAVVGGMASVFCYTWTKQSWVSQTNRTLSAKARLTVFASFAVVLICSLTTITESLGLVLHDFPELFSHVLLYVILISIIVFTAMVNDDSESLLARGSNGCLIVFGLAVGIGTVNYFAVNNNSREMGVGFAFSLLLMFYSALLYVCIVIWTMLSKQLRPNMFALKNWHLAEMFTFWVFAVMSPPSLWEALEAAGSDEEGKTEQMEMRISELEDRLAKLSSQDAVYTQPLDN